MRLRFFEGCISVSKKKSHSEEWDFTMFVT